MFLIFLEFNSKFLLLYKNLEILFLSQIINKGQNLTYYVNIKKR